MRTWLILSAIVFLFVAHSLSLEFTQDDAFISYRYAANLAEGNGLVFNPGERVEGYTNFLWVILLGLFARLGFDIIIASKLLGVVSGCTTLFVLYLVSRLFIPKKDWWLALFPSALLTASSAFAYWSISGLESAFFVMMVTVSVYFYLTQSRLLVPSCALSVLVRPEGALVFVIFLLYELFFLKNRLGESLLFLGGFLLLLLPFIAFKIWYYGDVLPNPFYAKTGLSFEYVQSGLEYFWSFLKHYGLGGLLYVLPVFFYRGSDQRLGSLMFLCYAYTLYVILIGGDVLKAHRFFLPVLPLLYVLLAISLENLQKRLRPNRRWKVVLKVSLFPLAALFFLLPQKRIWQIRAEEKNLVDKMSVVAEYLTRYYGKSYSLAVSTIGSISYHAGTGIRVIDMLGLTDKHISHHPEEIEGITVTWKEKRYNSQYVLSRDPDFIFFSTGFKPSAPAERALLLNSKFRQNYHVIPIFFGKTEFLPIFKRKGRYTRENEVFAETRFVDLFYEGVHFDYRREYRKAIEKMKQAALVGPQDFALMYELLGWYYFKLKDHSTAESYLKRAIQIDDYSVLAHVYLADIYYSSGRLQEAEAEKRKIFLYDANFPFR